MKAEVYDPPSPGETRIEGDWVLVDGVVRADEAARRIDWLVGQHLARIAANADGWSTLLRDPVDDRYWELTFPHGELHGGGPPMLVAVSPLDAEKRYRVTLPHAE